MRDSHGIPGLPVWALIVLAAIFVGTPALVIGSAVALRALTSRSALREPSARPARTHATKVARSGLAGLGVGLLLGLVLVVNERGTLAPLACAGGYLLGLLAGEYSAQPSAWGTRRAAALLARRATDYVPRVAAAAVALTTTLTLAAPVAFALAPSISYGRWHPFQGASFSLPGGRTSWPGLTLTVGGAALSVVALLLGTAGLRWIAARPQPAEGAERDIDELQRRQAGRAIAGAVLGLQLVVLAALMIAGSNGLAVPVPDLAPSAYLGSRVMIWAGLGCAAAAVVSWLVLSGWTGRARRASGGSPVEPGSSPGSGPGSTSGAAATAAEG